MIDLKKKSLETQMCGHGLLKVTYELLQSLERAAKGQPIDAAFLKQMYMETARQAEFLDSTRHPSSSISKQSMQERLEEQAMKAQTQAQRPDKRLQVDTSREADEMASTSNMVAVQAPPPPAPAGPVVPRGLLAPLDYGAIKHLLAEGSNPEQSTLLLQALRWRLSRNKGVPKRQVLAAYVSCDLLGVGAEVGRDSMLGRLLRHESEMVREYTARLVNTMATEVTGRSYLLGRGGIIAVLLDVLKAEGSKDTMMRQNVLGALQKFSLRRQPQSEMIQIGMIPWLISTLKEVQPPRSSSSSRAAVLWPSLSPGSLVMSGR